MNQIHKTRSAGIINSYSSEEELISKSLDTLVEADVIIKGGKRAFDGEIRTYNGQKWKKTSNGWEHVKDTHKAKSGDHHVKVHTVDKDHVHYDVHDNEGNKVAKHKMTHDQFKMHYDADEIHEVSSHLGGSGGEHIANYHKTEEVKEEPTTVTVKEEKKSIKLSDEDRKLMDRVEKDTVNKELTARYLIQKYDDLEKRGLVEYKSTGNGDIIKLTELGKKLLSKKTTTVESDDEIDEKDAAKAAGSAKKDISKEEVTEDDDFQKEIVEKFENDFNSASSKKEVMDIYYQYSSQLDLEKEKSLSKKLLNLKQKALDRVGDHDVYDKVSTILNDIAEEKGYKFSYNKKTPLIINIKHEVLDGSEISEISQMIEDETGLKVDDYSQIDDSDRRLRRTELNLK